MGGKFLRRTEFDLFQALDKFNESLGLVSQAVENFRVGEASLVVEQVVDLREKNAFGVKISKPVVKHELQLLDRPQCPPHAGGQPNEAHRTVLEALREFQHINEIFQNA